MTVAPGANDLAVVADAQLFIGSPNQDSDLLQTLITAASTFIQSILGYNIAATSYTETRSGHGKPTMALRYRPVISVQSLTIGNALQIASPGYGQTGYSFDDQGLYLTNCTFHQGFRNVTITYTAGYEQTPSDLKQACIELVALKYALRQKAGLVSESGLQQVTAYSQKDMPASVASAIQPYKIVFLA
jgi:hypothetical protein